VNDKNGGGPVKRQCVRTVLATGERCRNAPIKGGTVCHKHGGSAPQVKAAAARRVAEGKALAKFERYSPNGRSAEPVDVLAELAVLVREVTAFKDFAADRLRALTADDWRAADAGVAAEVAMFERAADHAGRLLTDVARLGLQERMVRMSEAEGARLYGAMNRALQELELSERQWGLARVVMPRMLRELAE
jgi:hypothetical protein